MSKKNRRDNAEDESEIFIQNRYFGCGNHYGGTTNFSRTCSEPNIPRRSYNSPPPNQNPVWYGSLSEVENSLSKKMYPLPKGAEKEVIEICGKKKTVSEKVGCVGNWVYRNIHYDSNHASLSSKTNNVLRTNKENDEKKGENSRCDCNNEYPLHRYLNSYEAMEAKAGICGENSEVIVAILRKMRIPAMLYRPNMSHFAAIAEDPDKHEFYVYDATSGSGCSWKGTPNNPARVVTKRWDPKSTYTLGVTPYADFVDWTLGRRRSLGTMKICQAIAGGHDDDGNRVGFFVDENGNLDESKLDLDWLTTKDKKKFKKLFKSCAKYVDSVYPDSRYHDISRDTEYIVRNPPKKSLIESFNGKEIVDLENAWECDPIPNRTVLGKIIEHSWREDCGGTPYHSDRVEIVKNDIDEGCSFEYGDVVNNDIPIPDKFVEEFEDDDDEIPTGIGSLFQDEPIVKKDSTTSDEDRFFNFYGMTPTEYFEFQHGYTPENDMELEIEMKSWMEQVPLEIDDNGDENEDDDFDSFEFFT